MRVLRARSWAARHVACNRHGIGPRGRGATIPRAQPCRLASHQTVTLRTGEYTVRVVIAVLIGALAFLLWRVREALVIVFGGIVLAVLVRLLMRPLIRHTPIRERWAL